MIALSLIKKAVRIRTETVLTSASLNTHKYTNKHIH